MDGDESAGAGDDLELLVPGPGPLLAAEFQHVYGRVEGFVAGARAETSPVRVVDGVPALAVLVGLDPLPIVDALDTDGDGRYWGGEERLLRYGVPAGRGVEVVGGWDEVGLHDGVWFIVFRGCDGNSVLERAVEPPKEALAGCAAES